MMAHRLTTCKHGHPKTPANTTSQGGCRMCKTVAEKRHRATKPRVSGKRLYCICGRCRSRWFEAFAQDPLGRHRPNPSDRWSGDSEYVPPKRECPTCGSRHNVSVFVDQPADEVFNLDPFTGRELVDEVQQFSASLQ
jgi:hypothetical protein